MVNDERSHNLMLPCISLQVGNDEIHLVDLGFLLAVGGRTLETLKVANNTLDMESWKRDLRPRNYTPLYVSPHHSMKNSE